jgi:hypothetical protein
MMRVREELLPDSAIFSRKQRREIRSFLTETFARR